jgi:hypothetical protein
MLGNIANPGAKMGSANVGLPNSNLFDKVDMLTNGPEFRLIIVNGPESGPESARAIPASPNITIIVIQVITTNFFIVFSPQKLLSNNNHPAANSRQQA